MAGIELRRAADRAVTRTDWLESRHSFAFGPHYDPDNVAFGPLVTVNSDLVQPGPGYQSHRHAGLEILTWVAAGVLEHVSGDTISQVRPGQLQYLSTGTGLEHAERSASATEPVRVVQLWLAGRSEGQPAYRIGRIPDGAWVLAASSDRPAPVRLRHVQAELFVGRLPAGRTIPLPAAAKLHVFVVSGQVSLDAHHLSAEDEARLTDTDTTMTAPTAAEVLVWAFA